MPWWKTMYPEIFEIDLNFFQLYPFYSLAIIRSVNFRYILKDYYHCFISQANCKNAKRRLILTVTDEFCICCTKHYKSMKLWNVKQQPHEHSFHFIILIAPGSIIILFFLLSRVWGTPIFCEGCYSHPSAIHINWSPVTLKLIYKALVSWKRHIVNIGNIKVIWQLESYNSVLNYPLFFTICFITNGLHTTIK